MARLALTATTAVACATTAAGSATGVRWVMSTEAAYWQELPSPEIVDLPPSETPCVTTPFSRRHGAAWWPNSTACSLNSHTTPPETMMDKRPRQPSNVARVLRNALMVLLPLPSALPLDRARSFPRSALRLWSGAMS